MNKPPALYCSLENEHFTKCKTGCEPGCTQVPDPVLVGGQGMATSTSTSSTLSYNHTTSASKNSTLSYTYKNGTLLAGPRQKAKEQRTHTHLYKKLECLEVCIEDELGNDLGKCACKSGFVRHNGKCIHPNNCPKPKFMCGDFGTFTNCGSPCPRVCADVILEREVYRIRGKSKTLAEYKDDCIDVCVPATCVCNRGYVFDDIKNLNCVSEEDCLKRNG